LTADGTDRRGFEELRVERGLGLGCVVVLIVSEDWQNEHLLWGETGFAVLSLDGLSSSDNKLMTT